MCVWLFVYDYNVNGYICAVICVCLHVYIYMCTVICTCFTVMCTVTRVCCIYVYGYICTVICVLYNYVYMVCAVIHGAWEANLMTY